MSELIKLSDVVSYVKIGGRAVGNVRKNTNRKLFLDTHKLGEDVVAYRLLNGHGTRAIDTETSVPEYSIVSLAYVDDIDVDTIFAHCVNILSSIDGEVRSSMLLTGEQAASPAKVKRGSMPPIIVAKQGKKFVLGDGTNRMIVVALLHLLQSLWNDSEASQNRLSDEVFPEAGFFNVDWPTLLDASLDYSRVPADVVSVSELERLAIELNTLHAESSDYQDAMAVHAMIQRKRLKDLEPTSKAVKMAAKHYKISESQVWKVKATFECLADSTKIPLELTKAEKSDLAVEVQSELDSGSITFGKAMEKLGTSASKSQVVPRLTMAQCRTIATKSKKDLPEKIRRVIDGESAPSGVEATAWADSYPALQRACEFIVGAVVQTGGIDWKGLLEAASYDGDDKEKSKLRKEACDKLAKMVD